MTRPWGRPSPDLDRLYNIPRFPIWTGGAQSTHRGEDISIEAFDGHWPAPISRVRGPRPWRSPGASGGSPGGPLLAPLLLALFLLPNPHQLHTPPLPADDHCDRPGREGSQRLSSPPFLPRGSRLPDSLCLEPLPPFLSWSHTSRMGFPLFFPAKSLYGRFLDFQSIPSPAVILLPTLIPGWLAETSLYHLSTGQPQLPPHWVPFRACLPQCSLHSAAKTSIPNAKLDHLLPALSV